MTGIPTSKYGDATINAAKLTDDVREHLYVFERCDHQPAVALLANGYADPTAAGPNRCLFRGGLVSRYTQLGTQTILGPIFDPTIGLDVSQDQTDNDGIEHVFGALGTYGAFTYTLPDNVFLRASFKIVDVSGTDDCNFGFRKNEAVQANVDDYDEAAWININLGDILTETILNGGATTTTDSALNWLDNETHEVEVQIIGRRVAFYVDGVLVGPTNFSFDSGEVVLPFFFFIQATTTPGKVYWKEIEIGPIEAKTSNGLNR